MPPVSKFCANGEEPFVAQYETFVNLPLLFLWRLLYIAFSSSFVGKRQPLP